MISKEIIFYGQAAILACDGRCDKAFGINGRPRRRLGDDEDDTIYLPDSAVGIAPGPDDIGTWEGEATKPSATPIDDPSLMNKWCARECERSWMWKPGYETAIPDLRHPTANIPSLHLGQDHLWIPASNPPTEDGDILITRIWQDSLPGPPFVVSCYYEASNGMPEWILAWQPMPAPARG